MRNSVCDSDQNELMTRSRFMQNVPQDVADYRSKMEAKSKVQRAQWISNLPEGTTQKVTSSAAGIYTDGIYRQ